MKSFNLPKGDEHFAQFFPIYQRQAYWAAMQLTKNTRTAIDVGAHTGLWTTRLQMDFLRVYAFEPDPENFKCLNRNVWDSNWLFRAALGAEPGWVGLSNPKPNNSGAWEITEGSDVIQMRMDDIPIKKLDLIKIDVQGSEESVLIGGAGTIRIWKPTIIMEENNEKAGELLKEWGFRERVVVNKDIIWTHQDND